MSACVVSEYLCLTFSFLHPELNTGQIQEGVGEAINGIVKHFHKPEKEVRDGSLDRPKHVLLLFITNGKKSSRLLRWPQPPSVTALPVL